jgi:hypothetical protein
MSGNRALRRALETKDIDRITEELPLLTDETIGFTGEMAMEWLQQRNHHNRPLNWKSVYEYRDAIRSGKFKLIPQGVILDKDGNILNGQNRLMAVSLAGSAKPVYLRVTRGCPREFAELIDRGRPQSARDLASRKTDKKHSPTEASIARAVCALNGELSPSADTIAAAIVANAERFQAILTRTSGTKKTKAVLMILAAICVEARSTEQISEMAPHTQKLADKLETLLLPETAQRCWGKGAAFSLALQQARMLAGGLKSR